jgi:nucleotide-binding universal stress UspA family protein
MLRVSTSTRNKRQPPEDKRLIAVGTSSDYKGNSSGARQTSSTEWRTRRVWAIPYQTMKSGKQQYCARSLQRTAKQK